MKTHYNRMDKILLSPQTRRRRDDSLFFTWELERCSRVVRRSALYRKVVYSDVPKIMITGQHRVRLGPPFYERMEC